jgi:hypothetical protein
MQQITVEPSVGQKLIAASEQAVICDEQGHVLGVFSPVAGRPDVEDLQLEPPLSIAQTEELRKNRTGKPLEEILRRLGY